MGAELTPRRRRAGRMDRGRLPRLRALLPVAM